jgi:uncharacterized protein YjbI with pentapeptide repeats
MSPGVEAALIAGGVGVLTLIGTLAAQFYGIRSTRSGTDKTLNQQSKQLAATLADQREQLDRTLAHQRDRTLNERFATAADRLGSDKPPAVRLAGVYAMAGLADDWPENRQTCVDILCAYLRLPYDLDPGEDATPADRAAYRANREVRHTIIRLITAHLRQGAAVSWQNLNLDFTGVVFDGGDFTFARFSGGAVSFFGADFSGGKVSFFGAEFSGGTVSFTFARFSGGTVSFTFARFSGGTVSFTFARFSGNTVNLFDAKFSGGTVDFFRAGFSGGTVNFFDAKFSGGTVDFAGAVFSAGTVNFGSAPISGGAVFSGGTVNFGGAEFSGGTVNFFDAKFSGGTVDFRGARHWSPPPVFNWEGAPPAGVMLPADTDAGDQRPA